LILIIRYCDGDVPPILYRRILKKLLLRALTKIQILVLNEIKNNGYYFTVTSLIEEISRKYGISPSTLRWNVKKLYELGMIECGNSERKGIPVVLTKEGKKILGILESPIEERSSKDKDL
jgi:DNA-binding MarR family transcriptional regulator